MPTPFDLAKDSHYYNAHFTPYKQSEILGENEANFCLSIDITWLSNPHQFWKQDKSKENIFANSKKQGTYEGTGNWESLGFRKKLNRILATHAGLVAPLVQEASLKEKPLSKLTFINEETIENLFQSLSTRESGVIFILTKKSDAMEAHAVSIASEFDHDKGILHLKFFDSDHGEVIFSYPLLFRDEISRGYILKINFTQDTTEPEPIRNFKHFLKDVFMYYQRDGYNFYKKYEYRRLSHEIEPTASVDFAKTEIPATSAAGLCKTLTF